MTIILEYNDFLSISESTLKSVEPEEVGNTPTLAVFTDYQCVFLQKNINSIEWNNLLGKAIFSSICNEKEYKKIEQALNYRIFEKFTHLGWVLKSGSIYGSDFIAYKKFKNHKKTDHSTLLICASNTSKVPITWLTSMIRTAQSVKKKFCVCWDKNGEIRCAIYEYISGSADFNR